ncbi:MAG: excinuclease ABC subunit UvrA [Bacteroidales bacterium]|nr:excinuclease ABC subunit UvrA [Bacteroidales bacterium]
MNSFDTIRIRGARENNLRNLSLDIPKYKITIFTGVSGSGKSSLVMDTIAAKSRRELNDTFTTFVQQYLPKYGRPKVDNIEGLPIAIVIDQKKPAQNSRSTVGTYTDIYALIRLLFSRVGKPFVGYSDSFSFNHPQGSCPRCAGLGEIRELDIHKLVDLDKSLNDEDTIHYIAFGKGGWRWIRYAHSGLFNLDKKIRDYSPEELDLFLNSPQIRLKNPPKNWPKTAKYEGLIPCMYRSIINSEEGLLHAAILNPMLRMGTCPDCGGTRLNPKVLSCKIEGLNIAEVCSMSINRLNAWVASLSDPLAADLKVAIGTRLSALEEIGLGYLSLNRPVGTLSGGEAQRCKIAKYINSSLSDVLYILDEPSVGLHPRDTEMLVKVLKALRDVGNTVLVVEHDRDIISAADYLVDVGPGAGSHGGEIVFAGPVSRLDRAERSVTADYLLGRKALPVPAFRRPWHSRLKIVGAAENNLKHIDVEFPLHTLCVVTGVSGSGKSTLVRNILYPALARYFEQYDNEVGEFRRLEGDLQEISAVECIDQHPIGKSSRSNPATYSKAYDEIRKLFAEQPAAKYNDLKPMHFTFNSEGGRCEMCQGEGTITVEMQFMADVKLECEACHGKRFKEEVLEVTYRGKSIYDVLEMSVDEAVAFFGEHPSSLEKKIIARLAPLQQVGLGYIKLGQSSSTLSGGENQRVKLASFLVKTDSIRPTLFIFDEPTTGLHLHDIRVLVQAFNALIEQGHSVIVIEHNVEVMKSADGIIDMGPEAGEAGGRVCCAGTPEQVAADPESRTAGYLRQALLR